MTDAANGTNKHPRGETTCEVSSCGYTRTIEERDGKKVWMCGNPRGCPTSGAAVEDEPNSAPSSPHPPSPQ